jgi:hypothetical protein
MQVDGDAPLTEDLVRTKWPRLAILITRDEPKIQPPRLYSLLVPSSACFHGPLTSVPLKPYGGGLRTILEPTDMESAPSEAVKSVPEQEPILESTSIGTTEIPSAPSDATKVRRTRSSKPLLGSVLHL